MKTLESAVSTLSNSEKLSALRDGQLGAADALALVRASLADERLVHEWRGLCVVSDTLGLQQATEHAMQSFAAIPSAAAPIEVLAPQPETLAQEAANDGVFRWKMVAGIAAFAAVGSLVWGLMGQTAPATQGGPVLAQAPATTQPAAQSPIQTVGTTANAAGLVAVQASPEAPVMIRDPRLDELLAAHKQFGGASALQQPAGSLRSASLSVPRQ